MDREKLIHGDGDARRNPFSRNEEVQRRLTKTTPRLPKASHSVQSDCAFCRISHMHSELAGNSDNTSPLQSPSGGKGAACSLMAVPCTSFIGVGA